MDYYCITVQGGTNAGVEIVAFADALGRVLQDNQGAVQLAKNPVTTHHFLRELVFKGEFTISHLALAKQHVDFMTTPLCKEAFRVNLDFLMNLC